MKYPTLIFVILLFIFESGCDSPNDSQVPEDTVESKATSRLPVEHPKFIVSAAAADVLKGAADTDRTKYVRATCTPGGCSGFIYDLQTTNDYDESTDQIFVSGDAKIVVDNVSLKLMSGASLDYITTTETAGFVFNKPDKISEPTSE